MTKSLILSSLIFISSQAVADQWDPMVNMALEQLKRSGELPEIAGCIGVSESTFIEKYRPILKSCLSQHGMALEGEAGEAAMDSCFEQEFVSQFGINKTTLDKCKEKFSDEETDEPEIDYSAMTDAEMRAQIEKEMQQGKERLEMMLEASKAASKGTEHMITLPVYQESEIMAHYSMGMQLEDGSSTLPVATFSSSHSVAQIVAFYQKQLPEFEMKTYQGGMAIFMETFPEAFDPLTDMQTYQSIPHITIYSLGNDSPNQTTIEIAYAR